MAEDALMSGDSLKILAAIVAVLVPTVGGLFALYRGLMERIRKEQGEERERDRADHHSEIAQIRVEYNERIETYKDVIKSKDEQLASMTKKMEELYGKFINNKPKSVP